MWLSVFLSVCDVDYCDVVWVNLDQALDTKIQKLQNSAARITILQGYSVRSAEIRKQIIKTRRDYSWSVFKSNLHDLCVLCQVTWLNADDPSTEWLSIWMDRRVSWVPDDCILRSSEPKGLPLCWQRPGVCSWHWAIRTKMAPCCTTWKGILALFRVFHMFSIESWHALFAPSENELSSKLATFKKLYRLILSIKLVIWEIIFVEGLTVV